MAAPTGTIRSVKTEVDLYVFGRRGPRPPRIKGYNLKPEQKGFDLAAENGIVGPTDPITGASAFGDPYASGLSGPYYRLPAGSELPEGIGIAADGYHVGGDHQRTHHTIYPVILMPADKFVRLFVTLGWLDEGGRL